MDPGDSTSKGGFPLRRSLLDPRTHLILTFEGMGALIVLNHWILLSGCLGVLGAVILSLRLVKPWIHFLTHLALAVVTFLAIAWIAFDFETGIVSGLRLLAIGTVFFLFFQRTSPEALSEGLLRWGCPPAFVFVLNASLQFIPILTRRARNIRDAQRSRGIPIEGGIRSLPYLPALAGPLLIQAFRFADELAEAMEARGFGLQGRTFRHELRFKGMDWFVVSLSTIGFLLLLLLNVRLLPLPFP